MSDQLYLNYLKNQISEFTLSESDNEILNETYNNLGKQEKAKSKAGKRALISSASVAACLAILLSVNAAFPAFAESIPLIGDIFKQANYYSKSPTGTNISTYDGVQKIEHTAVPSEDTGSQLTVKDAYSDGELVHISVELTDPEGILDEFFNIYSSVTVTINGKEMVVTSGPYMGGNTFYLKNNGKYISTTICNLPEGTENGDKLAVKVSFDKFCGWNNSDKENVQSVNIPGFSAEFDITADTSHNRLADLYAYDNDAHLISVSSTPSNTTFKIDLPKRWEDEYIAKLDSPNVGISFGIPVMYTPDGTRYEINSKSDWSFVEEWQPSTLIFDGVPNGTESVILRIYEEYDYETVLAEFTVDIISGTASATTTYNDGGILDIYHPDNFTYVSMGDGYIEEDEAEFKNKLALAYFDYSNDYKYTRIDIYSKDEYREVEIELCSGKDLLGKATSQNISGPDSTSGFFPPTEHNERIYNFYSFEFTLNDGVKIDTNTESFTIKVLDTSNGSEIAEFFIDDVHYLRGKY